MPVEEVQVKGIRKVILRLVLSCGIHLILDRPMADPARQRVPAGTKAESRPRRTSEPDWSDPVVSTEARAVLLYNSLVNYRKLMNLGAAVLVVSLLGNVIAIWRGKEIFWQHVTEDLRVIATQPLNEPVLSDSRISEFVSSAVVDSFSFDFRRYKEQIFGATEIYFTEEGAQSFKVAIDQSGILPKMLDANGLVITTTRAAPIVVDRAVTAGLFAWKVQVPIMVTRYEKSQQIPMNYRLELVIVRDNALAKHQAVGIAQWFMRPE